jgi:hypothetical protein
MDAINSIVAVAATLAGIWAASLTQEIRSEQNESVVAARYKASTRSINSFSDFRVRAAPTPIGAGRPLR